MPDDEGWDFEGEAVCIGDSGKAIRVRLANGVVLWIPQSQVHGDSEVYRKGDRGKLVVTRWWHEQQRKDYERRGRS